jgi:hypothetical protein
MGFPQLPEEQLSCLLLVFFLRNFFWSHFDDHPLKDVKKMAIIFEKI